MLTVLLPLVYFKIVRHGINVGYVIINPLEKALVPVVFLLPVVPVVLLVPMVPVVSLVPIVYPCSSCGLSAFPLFAVSTQHS